MGLQQTSQSSIYVWRRTDVSNTIEILFQQYGQVKKYSMSYGPAAWACSLLKATSGFCVDRFRRRRRYLMALATPVFLLFAGLEVIVGNFGEGLVAARH
jgi:hypothetical protein